MRQVAYFKRCFRVAGAQLTGRCGLGELLADHHLDDFGRNDIFFFNNTDVLAITQDRDAVGQVEYFFQTVGDVDDGYSPVSQLVDDLVQQLGFSGRKGSCRLIHDDQPGIRCQCLQDFNHLLLRYRQRFNNVCSLQRESVAVDQFLDLCLFCLVGDNAELADFLAEQDILVDRQCRNQ